jgi:hypothetical protein
MMLEIICLSKSGQVTEDSTYVLGSWKPLKASRTQTFMKEDARRHRFLERGILI